MASVLLSAAGAAVGSAALPAGVNFLGANISGAAIGNAVGSIAGSLIVDQEVRGSIPRSSTIIFNDLGLICDLRLNWNL